MSKKKSELLTKDIDVEIGGAESIKLCKGKVNAFVYPLGLRHLRKFNKKFEELIPILGEIFVPKEAEKDDVQIIKSVVAAIGPKLVEDFFELLEDCIVFPDSEDLTLEHLPHYELAPVAEKWILVSFGEERKYSPWIRAIDNVVQRFTKKPFSITAIFSKRSSQTDIVEEISSTKDKETKMEEIGPT